MLRETSTFSPTKSSEFVSTSASNCVNSIPTAGSECQNETILFFQPFLLCYRNNCFIDNEALGHMKSE